jgi:uncharacterized membrane protein YraQ (UPF0718 family)
MNIKDWTKSFQKAIKSISNIGPTLIGIILLISLVTTFLTPESYLKIFSGNSILDPIIGSTIGSILAGNPITSLIIGGELQKIGVSLVAITAFIVSWITVGLVQLPAESMTLGKKFAIMRNGMAFVFSIIMAVITVFLVNII